MTRAGLWSAVRWARAAAMPIALLLVSGSAAAQDREADAERLFREGQKLLEQRRFGEACPKFEQAYTKDRQLGTLINLAFCHQEQGAIWYAWLEFREAEVKATELQRPDRRDFAKQRLVELEKVLPKIVIDNPHEVPLIEVLVEDRRVWEAERGAAFAAERGQRKFVFRAKGKKPATALIDVSGSHKVQHVAVPEMVDGSPDPPSPAAGDEAPAESAKGDPAPKGADPGATQRTLGWVALGAGGAAVVVGTITGLVTLSSACSGGKSCDADQRSSATTTGTVSDVAFILGAVGIGVGAVVVLTAPSASARSASQSSLGARAKPRVGGVAARLGLGFVGLSGSF